MLNRSGGATSYTTDTGYASGDGKDQTMVLTITADFTGATGSWGANVECTNPNTGGGGAVYQQVKMTATRVGAIADAVVGLP